ncbi:MAG: phosphopentomutase [Bacilli bacterium]|nr:phosphopentomutase [Bacilli bacterium]
MYKRIFLIVFDSLGIGNGKDAKKFDDVGSNTLNSVLGAGKFNLPCLSKLGFLNLSSDRKYHQNGYEGIICKLNEVSAGKDTLTGHYEIMGLKVEKPSVTFTETGFPDELIEELERRWGRKIIGNKSASGTEIIKELGERHMKTGEAIVYTSADSVLQIAANEAVIPLKELYKMCEIAREVTLKDEWKVDRIIARPFIGTNATNFTRTSNRHDYATSPFAPTYMDNLKEAGYDVIAIGKINDIFNGQGITYFEKTKSNIDGMEKTIRIAKDVDFTGLCFVNLVEFDSEYGHRRNPIGYLRCLEDADVKMRALVNSMKDDDLLIITADHGNDPTYKGTDHTREQVPFVAYSKSLVNKGHMISSQDTFACIGATIIDNFNVDAKDHQIGKSLLSMIK